MSQLETSIWGTLIGTSTVALLHNGLTSAGMSPFWQDLVVGVLLSGFALDQIFRERQRKL